MPNFLWAWIVPNCRLNILNQTHQSKVIILCYHVSNHYGSGWPVLPWDNWSLPTLLWSWIDPNCRWNFSHQTHQSKVMNLCYHVNDHYGSGWPVLPWDHWSLPTLLWAWIDSNNYWNFSNETHHLFIYSCNFLSMLNSTTLKPLLVINLIWSQSFHSWKYLC